MTKGSGPLWRGLGHQENKAASGFEPRPEGPVDPGNLRDDLVVETCSDLDDPNVI